MLNGIRQQFKAMSLPMSDLRDFDYYDDIQNWLPKMKLNVHGLMTEIYRLIPGLEFGSNVVTSQHGITNDFKQVDELL